MVLYGFWSVRCSFSKKTPKPLGFWHLNLKQVLIWFPKRFFLIGPIQPQPKIPFFIVLQTCFASYSRASFTTLYTCSSCTVITTGLLESAGSWKHLMAKVNITIIVTYRILIRRFQTVHISKLPLQHLNFVYCSFTSKHFSMLPNIKKLLNPFIKILILQIS